MKSKRLLNILTQVDEENIAEAAPLKLTVKNHRVNRVVMAACIVFVLAISIMLIYNQNNGIPLSDASTNVKVRFVKTIPQGIALNKPYLEWLSEEELFSKYNPVLFKGSVKRINNIALNFNGDEIYRAIAEIKVEKVYHGDIRSGETLFVLLPCPIDKGNKMMEDTGIISQMQVGSTGIFMPMEYDESSVWEQNGATLVLKDVAKYGLPDGMRFVFLETDTGLVFAREAYESISNATTLQEVEDYVLKMIK